MRRQGKVKDTVLIVEHPPTVTFGVREGINRLVGEKESLEREGISLVKTNRGGGATAHNPGQLVCYPIIDLSKRRMTVDEYVSVLEDIGICLLDKLGVTAVKREVFPGLWVVGRDDANMSRPEKIASIGIHLSGMVTSHGMAINITNDLSIFDHIVPCGMDGVSITSVRKSTGVEHEMKAVKEYLVECVRKYLGMEQ